MSVCLSVCPNQTQHFIDRALESHIPGTKQALGILNPEQAVQGNSAKLQTCIHICLTAELGYAFGKNQSKELSPIASRVSRIIKWKVLVSC